MILNPIDQNIRDQGFNFVPFSRYLSSPFQTPTIDDSTADARVSAGLPTIYQPRGGNSIGYTGGVTDLIDNFNVDTRNRYFDSQKTPLVDNLYQSKLDRTFMGFPSFKEQELTGPDLGAYIGSGTDVPLEPTMAGSIQSKIGNVTGGIKDLIGKVPSITGLLSRMGVQNFNSLSPLDQAFIQQNSGYTGPTIFGENTMGTSKDPFGRNVESLFGNYAGKVRDDFSNLSTALSPTGKIGSKEDYKGATFNPETGRFEPDDDDDEDAVKAAALANQMNKMNLAKFAFDQKQLEKQAENQKVSERNTATRARAANPDVYARADAMGFTDGKGGGFGSKSTGTNENFSNKTGRGRTGYLMGGLTDLVDIYD